MTETLPVTTLTSDDGTHLAVHDLGGSGPPLLLAHATGFQARAYGPLARAIAGRFHVLAFDARGHGESGDPPSLAFDPKDFARDVLAVVDALALETPAAFGHSSGATALVLAEQARHGTFSSLYCFEPIILPLNDPPPHDAENPLSRAARNRRHTFSSLEAAYENYASKPPLDMLAPDALWAYVESAFEPGPRGTVQLRCRGEHEALMYAHGLTHDAFPHLGKVACPVTFACGEVTDAIGVSILAQLATRTPQARVEVLSGLGHFGPLEDPASVAASLLRATCESTEPEPARARPHAPS